MSPLLLVSQHPDEANANDERRDGHDADRYWAHQRICNVNTADDKNDNDPPSISLVRSLVSCLMMMDGDCKAIGIAEQGGHPPSAALVVIILKQTKKF